MSIFTTIFYVLPIAIAFLSLLAVYLFVLLPKRRLAFYAKQGIKTRYLPIIGAKNMRRQIMEETGDCMSTDKAASKTEPELRITAINLGKDILLGLRDTEYIKEFLYTPANFKKAKYFGVFKPLLGSGLLFVEGDQWKIRRKLISSSFHYEFITSNTQLIQETAREFLDKIPSSEYKNCLVMDRLQEITGEVVGRIFFGRNLNRYNFEGQPLTLALTALMADLGDFVRTPLYMLLNVKTLVLPIPQRIKLTRRIKAFRAQCEKIIQDRKNENQRYHDLLDALLEQQRQEPVDSDKRLTDEDIMNEFITFFMAGMDTTGHLVTMMLYNLTQHPQYLKQLEEERKVLYDTRKDASVEAIQSMNVLTCFIKETLRHHTPAPTVFPREAAKDVQLKDILIKKGTLVKTDPLVLFHNSEYFEEPEKFKPERWENPNNKMDPFAFIPFSAGPRNCIGQHLAMLEAKIIMSEFLERFEFKVSEGYKLKMMFRFLYEPYDDMRMDLSRK